MWHFFISVTFCQKLSVNCSSDLILQLSLKNLTHPTVWLCPISYSLDSLSPSRLASGASTAVPNWIQCFQWVCNMIHHGCTQPCSKCRIHHWKSFAAMPIIQIFPRYYPCCCWWSSGSGPEWGISVFRNEMRNNIFWSKQSVFSSENHSKKVLCLLWILVPKSRGILKPCEYEIHILKLIPN